MSSLLHEVNDFFDRLAAAEKRSPLCIVCEKGDSEAAGKVLDWVLPWNGKGFRMRQWHRGCLPAQYAAINMEPER